MKMILRLILAPVFLLLKLMIWSLSAVLYCSAHILGFVSLGILILAIPTFFHSIQNGLILLALAFLISPMGLPMAAAWLIGRVNTFHAYIEDTIFH